MEDRGASLIGRTLKLTFAINKSCLAKERCIPDTNNSAKIYTFLEKFFLNGTKDLLKLRPGIKTLFLGLLTIPGSKVKVSSV
jgi:hypothetical protein